MHFFKSKDFAIYGNCSQNGQNNMNMDTIKTSLLDRTPSGFLLFILI